MSTTVTKPDLSITITEHPNVGRMRAGFDAFSRGDLDAVHATLTDDCTWTNSGTSAIAGTYQGWNQIVGMFAKLLDLTAGTFSMSLASTIADDTHAVTIYDATSTIAGVTESHRFVAFVFAPPNWPHREPLPKEMRETKLPPLLREDPAADPQF